MRAATEARACPSGPLGLALSGQSWAPTPGAVGRGASGPSYQFKEARSLPTGKWLCAVRAFRAAAPRKQQGSIYFNTEMEMAVLQPTRTLNGA